MQSACTHRTEENELEPGIQYTQSVSTHRTEENEENEPEPRIWYTQMTSTYRTEEIEPGIQYESQAEEIEPGIQYTQEEDLTKDKKGPEITKKRNIKKVVKNGVLDLAENIPENQRKILSLGPKFAVTPKSIPYMEIVTTTEIEALKLEKKGETAKAQLLRQEVKKILMKEKKPKSNLSKEQLRTISEIKQDKNIDIYPYDKGNGFVRMLKETAKIKMIEGIGETKILDKDPTKSHLDKRRN
jgi:hypothetical protein